MTKRAEYIAQLLWGLWGVLVVYAGLSLHTYAAVTEGEPLWLSFGSGVLIGYGFIQIIDAVRRPA